LAVIEVAGFDLVGHGFVGTVEMVGDLVARLREPDEGRRAVASNADLLDRIEQTCV
jgi:hypothetical protein